MAQGYDEAGNLWEIDADGIAVRLLQPANASQGRVFTLPQSPKDAAAAARQARIDAENAAERERDNERADRSLALQEAKAAGGGAKSATQIEIEAKADAAGKRAATVNSLTREVRRLYEKDIKGQPVSRLFGATEYIDSLPNNERFTAAGNTILPLIRPLIAQTAKEGDSNTELLIFQSYVPSANDSDQTIEQKLKMLDLLIGGMVDGKPPSATVNGGNTGIDGQRAEDERDKVAAVGNDHPDGLPPANQPGGNDPTPLAPASGGGTQDVARPDIASMVRSMIAAGAGFSTVNAALKAKGARTLSFSEFNQAKQGRAIEAHETRPLTLLEKAASSKLGTAGIGAANALTMGGIDEITGGLNSMLNGTSYEAERDMAQGAKEASAALNPGSYFGGSVLGGLATGFGGAAALSGTRAASALASLPGSLAAGTTYGATNGALESNGDRATGALWGGGAGLLGTLAGRYALAPVTERVGRLFGNAPRLAPEEGALPAIPDSVLTNLQDAKRLGLPYSLADADPALQLLSGTVTRKSPNARVLAETIFEPRGRGQAERAFDAIDTRLAPVTDIAERSAQWKQAAQTASAPHYAAMKAQNAPMDARVNAMLDTPVGRAALRDARTIAANEGRDPDQMGFIALDNGDVAFGTNPSWETLDFVKRGIDQQLNSHRNQFTGKLNLEGNPQAQAIEGFRQRFVSTLDELSPEYREARGAYQSEIRNRDALERGTKMMAPQVRPRELPPVLEGFDERQLAEAQRGAATNMADTVNNAQLTGNPYNRVYGTPAQQEKVGMLFPEGAQDFARVTELERDMGKTLQETLGGSPTAARLAADQQLGGLGTLGTAAIDAGSQALTGGGIPAASLFQIGRQTLADYAKLGVGKKASERADKLAPALFNTEPDAAIAWLTDLAARKAAMAQRKANYGGKGALLGALLAPSFLPSGS